MHVIFSGNNNGLDPRDSMTKFLRLIFLINARCYHYI